MEKNLNADAGEPLSRTRGRLTSRQYNEFPIVHDAKRRTWLESLSTGELARLADSFGIDIPPGLERIFIIEELLEYSNSIGQEEKDDIKIDSSYPETAELPKQYNISFVEVMIRDPLWVFVFWEIKRQDRELHEKAEDFNGYCLRLVPLKEGKTEIKEDAFTVQVDMNDSSRYLGFAPLSSPQSQSRYVIKLDAIRGSSEFQIAQSEPFCMPRLIKNENISSMEKNPLVRLSAVSELLIIKSADRRSKSKGQ